MRVFMIFTLALLLALGNIFVFLPADQAQAQTYKISGNVSGATDVTVTLSGDTSDSVVTSGAYSFTGLPTGDYTVTPSKDGYTFDPSSYPYSPLSGSQTGQNFTASICYPAIEGTPDTEVTATFPYSFTPTGTDVCSTGSISYSIQNCPSWASLDTSTGGE
ncbi:MAG: carboxypeptidase-like regulatory domain-containing protein [Dehalococcoidia bacterium]